MHREEFEGYTYWVAFWKGLFFPLAAAKPMLDETAEKSGLSWKLGSLIYPLSYTFLLKICVVSGAQTVLSD